MFSLTLAWFPKDQPDIKAPKTQVSPVLRTSIVMQTGSCPCFLGKLFQIHRRLLFGVPSLQNLLSALAIQWPLVLAGSSTSQSFLGPSFLPLPGLDTRTQPRVNQVQQSQEPIGSAVHPAS